jgi:hypothetical protein
MNGVKLTTMPRKATRKVTPKKRAAPKRKPKRKPVRKPGKVILPQPKRGTLGAFGYKDVQKLTVAERHYALAQAVRAYGKTSVGRKLRLVQTFNRRTKPKVAKIFGADADWVRGL